VTKGNKRYVVWHPMAKSNRPQQQQMWIVDLVVGKWHILHC